MVEPSCPFFVSVEIVVIYGNRTWTCADSWVNEYRQRFFIRYWIIRRREPMFHLVSCEQFHEPKAYDFAPDRTDVVDCNDANY